jgi:hypothetical protein
MKTYSLHGITEFIVAPGYKAEVLREYFAVVHLRNCPIIAG